MGKDQLSEYLQMKFVSLQNMFTDTVYYSRYKCLNSTQHYMNEAALGFSSQETTFFSIKLFQEQEEGITLLQDIRTIEIIMYRKNCNSISMLFCW